MRGKSKEIKALNYESKLPDKLKIQTPAECIRNSYSNDRFRVSRL